MLVGLTGGYCSGKNAAAAILEKRGFVCFDVDKLGHEALRLEESMEAIAWRFGPSVLLADGSLDKKALAAIVFDDPEGLADLEAIIHPAVYRMLRPLIKAARDDGRDVCLNAALLYKMPDAADCDVFLEIKAPLLIRVIRGCARDDLGIRAVLSRIRSQSSFWKKRPKSVRRHIVENKGNLSNLEESLAKVLALMDR